MIYKGSRLQALVQSHGGTFSDLGERMAKYKSPRKNGSSTKGYRLDSLYKDGHNIQLNTLTALVRETGRTVDYFVDFEPGELARSAEGVSGNNNIINSSFSSDLTQKIEHLNEVLHLNHQLLAEKERIITLKDAEIDQWKKRYDDLIRFAQLDSSDKNRT